MFDWDDVQSFCDDLSKWIEETHTVDQLALAHPRSTFPLKADPAIDTIEESWGVLVYLTLWIACKTKSKAPPCLESRLFLSEKCIDGPWAKLYIKLMERGFTDPEEKWVDVFNLAG